MNFRTSLVCGLTAVLSLVGWSRPLFAAPSILGTQVAETKTYPAFARLVLDTPVPGTFLPGLQPFVFNGTNTYEFTVTGTVTIRQAAPSNSFTDDITSTIYTAPGGLSAIEQEIVSVSASSFSSTNPLASLGGLVLGDGGDDGINSTPGNSPRSFFSTGGAVENNPDGSTADGFLNLFLQVNVTNPQIPTTSLQLINPLFQASYPIGQLYNKDLPLHLERNINAYQPFFQTFSIPLGSPTVEMFMDVNHPLVKDLNTLLGRPLIPLKAAAFTIAELTIVPECSSLLLAGWAAVGFARFARRTSGSPRPSKDLLGTC
jgi:hypothetical protein